MPGPESFNRQDLAAMQAASFALAHAENTVHSPVGTQVQLSREALEHLGEPLYAHRLERFLDRDLGMHSIQLSAYSPDVTRGPLQEQVGALMYRKFAALPVRLGAVMNVVNLEEPLKLQQYSFWRIAKPIAGMPKPAIITRETFEQDLEQLTPAEESVMEDLGRSLRDAFERMEDEPQDRHEEQTDVDYEQELLLSERYKATWMAGYVALGRLVPVGAGMAYGLTDLVNQMVAYGTETLSDIDDED